ncbi:hypothetical protein BH23ACT2_BH23ACT2_28340 [soil metagenome]
MQRGGCDQDTPTDCAVVLAEAAITSNTVAECEDHALLAVAEVLYLEAEANGQGPTPDTWWLRRGDGRKVAVYRLPSKAVTS